MNTHIQETWGDIKDELVYSDSREKRIFCFSRYTLSYLLPDIAKQINRKTCFHTGKGNFFTIETPNQQEYEIYFKVSKSDKGLLRLFIESAYIRDNLHKSSQPKKKKYLFMLLLIMYRLIRKLRYP